MQIKSAILKYIFFTVLIFNAINLYAQEQPESFDEYYAQALVAEEQGNFSQGIDILTQAIRTNGPKAYYYIKRGEMFYALQRYATALADFKEAQKEDEEYALFQTAVCYARLDETENLISVMEEYFKLRDKRSLSEIRLHQAFAHLENDRKWVDFINQKHYKKAETELDEAAYLINAGKITEAYNLVNERIGRNSRYPKAYILRGDIFMLNEQFRKAEKDYTKAVEAEPDNPEYFLKRIEACLQREDYQAAAQDYRRILELRPNELVHLKELARIEFKAGSYKEAKAAIEKYERYFSTTPAVLYLKALILKETGDHFGALKALNKCIEADASEYKYFQARALSYAEAGMSDRAESDFAMALDLHPSGELYYQRALLRIEIGNTEGACYDIKMAEHLKYYKAADLRKNYCE
jgi:tetratricopeptide (TPR) repeat protein